MSTMIASHSLRTSRGFRLVRRFAMAAALGLSLQSGFISAPAIAQEGQVIAVVNGFPITGFDIPQRQRLLQLINGRAPSRQEALDDIINDRVKFVESRRFRVQATDAQVDQAFAQVAARSGVNPIAFEQVLRSQGIEARVYKGRIRADLSWTNLIQARYGRTVFVPDAQLDAEVNKRTSGNSRAVEYTLRQVTVVVAPNAAPGVVQQRAGVVQTLRSRFENCTTGPELINATTDAAIREPIRRSSSDLGAEFRRVLDSTQVGRLTPPSRTSQGFEMIALCGKNEMRSDNQVMRNQVRDELTQTELRRISQTYLQQIRRQAVIEYPRGRP
ncbi:MAG: hypothetical protein WCH83_04780 [Alphaproteobacteria bacterium]